MAVKREFFMAFFRAIFCGVFCALVSLPAFAGVGSVDTRQYADWASEQFSRYVTIGSVKRWRCTGQYVAPNLILTAAHCYNGKQDIGRIEYLGSALFDGTFIGKVIAMGDYKNVTTTPKEDWALVLIEDKEFYYPKDNFFNPDDLDKQKEYESVISAGFGWARIVNDKEVELLRAAFETAAEKNEQLSISDIRSVLDDVMRKNNLKPFKEGEAKLTYDSCNVIINLNCWYVCNYDEEKCREVCRNRGGLFNDKDEWPEVLGTTCDTWGGNSGGAYFSKNTGKLVLIDSSGHDSFSFDDESEEDYGLSALVLNKVIMDARKRYPVESKVVTESGNAEKPAEIARMPVQVPVVEKPVLPSSPVDNTEALEGIQATINGIEEENMDSAENAGLTMSDDYITTVVEYHVDKVETILNDGNVSSQDVINVINSLTTIEALEEQYKRAKERETSVANRILSGATIAATGLGGMELARGIAEQSADKDAAADMAAYMATFQCKIGDNGNKINGGDMGITTPGANQLINLYQSYVDLAASVKARKADLGLRPGIEADVVLDKSATGLYDDKGNGVQNGTYASLYRAARGNQSDIDKLAEQSDASTNRVQIGGTAAGAGAVGGAVGNVLINHTGSNKK